MFRSVLLSAVLLAAPAAAQPAEGFPDSLSQRLELHPSLLLAETPPPAQPAATPSVDFDLLGAPKAAPATADDPTVYQRRAMLKVHQGIGIGLMVLTLSTVVVGQLNYRDRFGGGDRSGRFTRAHAGLAWGTAGLFLTNGLIALLAPSPIEKESQGFDRATLHKTAMIAAGVLMVAEAVLGIITASSSGLTDQRDLAKAHLIIGYGTYAAMATGVSAFIF